MITVNNFFKKSILRDIFWQLNALLNYEKRILFHVKTFSYALQIFTNAMRHFLREDSLIAKNVEFEFR